MKKLVALLLVLSLAVLMFAGCGKSSDAPAAEESAKKIKVGVVLVGDENEGYTYAHIEGLEKAMAKLGIDKSADAVWKYSIGEDETCYDAIADCIDQGCNIVFTNSYGHQSFAKQAAEENPNVQIVAMTGDQAKASGLANFHNAFTEIYEARYVAGIVAGMKIDELDKRISEVLEEWTQIASQDLIVGNLK